MSGHILYIPNGTTMKTGRDLAPYYKTNETQHLSNICFQSNTVLTKYTIIGKLK